MSKVKVTTRFKILELIDKFVDSTTANSIGRAVAEEALQNISQGLSPVRGEGRYEKYSKSYTDAIKGAVAQSSAKKVAKSESGTRNIKRRKRAGASKSFAALGKKVRPVNLHLYGKMLQGYWYRLAGKDSILVGMVRGGAKEKEIASYHQEGTANMPARKIVPGDGEEWSISIMRRIRDLYGKRLEFLIRQSNKKG